MKIYNPNASQATGDTSQLYSDLAAYKKKNKMGDLYNQLAKEQELQYSQAEMYQKRLLDEIQKGYGGAIAQANRGANLARRGVADMRTQSLGAVNQQLMNSGLGNTTLAANATRGIYGDSVRRLAEVNSQLGMNLGQLQTQRAGAMAGALGSLSGFYQDKSQAQTALGLRAAQMLQKPKHKSPLGGILGAIGGSVFGPIGSSIGASLFGGGNPTYEPGYGQPPWA